MKSKFTGEHKFWASMAESLNPDWDFVLHPDFAKSGTTLCAHDALIYVVDCQSGWTGVGAIRGEELMRIKQRLPAVLKSSGLTAAQVSGMASVKIQEAAASALNESLNVSEALNFAIKAAAHALADTRTFEIVLEKTHKLAGHWIYLVYSLNNGESMGRPTYTNSPETGLMDMEQLLVMTRQLIAHDLGSPKSFVGGAIVTGGGGQWHSTLV